MIYKFHLMNLGKSTIRKWIR